ncbi:MAG: glycosyltransferase family protein [Methanoregula sp.]|nr:glycosyltransferase family protein [Methanoregula sp.]
MKILFVVCGEGLGHASRCLHLGHYMQQQGHTIHFAGYGKSYDFMQQHGCNNLHKIPREVYLEGDEGFFSLKKTLLYSKWIPYNLLKSAAKVRRLLKDHAFDCVVCDTMFGGVISARARKVPCIFITNQNYFNGLNGATNPVWNILNILLRQYLRFATHIIIPDYPAPDTISEYNLRILNRDKKRFSFTGPFYEFDPARYPNEKRTIFTSFGGEPYKLHLYAMLKAIADQRKDLIFDAFYTGPKLPDSSENFFSHGYVPNIYEHLAKARIAIVHGGLTTLHEALLFEKPVLIIMDPSHPEQQNNARKIVKMGVGTVVNGKTVTKEELEQKITETMALTPYPFREVHAKINGKKNAAGIIEAVANRRKS